MDRVFREYVYADDLQYSAHALPDSKGLIENGHHEINACRDPDLGLHSVLAEPVESLDPQVLLDPFEEQLDLPAGLVDLGDDDGLDFEVVGYEHEQFPRLCIEKANSSEVAWIVPLAFRISETDRLIAPQASGLFHRPGLLDVIAHVGFGSGHEESRCRPDPIEPPEIDVSAIHYIEGSGLENYPIQGVDVVNLPFCDRDEYRDRASQVNHGVQLDSRLGPPEPSPRKESQAQVYSGCIQGVDDLVDLLDVGIVRIQFLRLPNENLSEFKEHPPVAMFVGVCYVGASCLSQDAHRVEQSGLGGQACFDVAQAFPKSKLSKDHAKELVPGREASAFSWHEVFGYASIELFSMNQFDDLREDKTTDIHATQSQQASDSMEYNSNASHTNI